ncbi:MAG: hypothetical protein HDT14_05420, partial [Oscillibacter sp.]|nr:hypothetical protein [Oscillibacter sp.]
MQGTGEAAISDNCIILKKSGSFLNFTQDVSGQNVISNHKITVSVLVSGNVKVTLRCNEAYPIARIYNNEDTGILNFTYTLPEQVDRLSVILQPQDNEPVAAYAGKLELGSHQTLARQNADGEWEIIDPPDYDLQYLLCSQYSPITGEWVGSQHSNPNLLYNWYWAAPINQRGQGE